MTWRYTDLLERAERSPALKALTIYVALLGEPSPPDSTFRRPPFADSRRERASALIRAHDPAVDPRQYCLAILSPMILAFAMPAIVFGMLFTITLAVVDGAGVLTPGSPPTALPIICAFEGFAIGCMAEVCIWLIRAGKLRSLGVSERTEPHVSRAVPGRLAFTGATGLGVICALGGLVAVIIQSTAPAWSIAANGVIAVLVPIATLAGLKQQERDG